MIKQLFHYYEYVPENEKANLFGLANVTAIEPKDRDKVSFPTLGIELTYRTLLIRGDIADNKPASINFTPIMLERKPDGSTGYKVVEVPPGEYNLYMGFLAKNHPFVNIYVDDKLVAKSLNVEPSTPWNYDRATNTVAGTKYNGWGGLVGPVVIEGDLEVGYAVPAEVELHVIDGDDTHGYFYTNDRVYFVDLSNRTVVYSPGVVVAAESN